MWQVCTPQNIAANGWGGFSAAAYFFGRHLHKELKVPIGLLDVSYGGSPAENWISRPAAEANPVLKPFAVHRGYAMLYNGMLAPLIPYAIRGAIWYQGESNVRGPIRYRTLFPAMIANWRADWGQGDFPFIFIQISPWHYTNIVRPTDVPELRESQLMTLKASPNTGMVVTTDIGDLQDIHPKNKQEVGRRLALWALANAYGKKDVVFSGPIYKSMVVESNKIRLAFDHVHGGLKASDGKPLSNFIIAGDDRKFVPATAEIVGDSLVIHSDQVAKPVAVRFAWSKDATPNLANNEGLPASPFRTDVWVDDPTHE
jgi:sialate O-acetylesterase